MDSEFFLMQRMKNGSEEAMELFVREYYPMIWRYCRLHVADAGHAEDLAQETFVHFFRALPEYRHLGKAANYLHRIAGNLCRDYYKRHTELFMEELPREEQTPISALEEKLDVEEALRRLPRELREVIILYSRGQRAK